MSAATLGLCVGLFGPGWQSADRLYTLGHYPAALARYEAWVPNSGCGNCQAAMSDHRAYGIACCRFKLGDATAAAHILMAELDDNWMGAEWCGQRLFELYRDAGRLDVLARMVAGRDAARVPRRLLAIRQLAELHETAALVAICGDCNLVHDDTTADRTTSWRSQAAAAALASLGSAGAMAAGEAALNRDRRLTAVSWLIDSLGRNPSLEAYRYLELLREREQSWDRPNVEAAMRRWRAADRQRAERDVVAGAAGGLAVSSPPLVVGPLPDRWPDRQPGRR